MAHAKDNMAFSVDVNCQPNDATEPASIANQKIQFISLSELLKSEFGATDAKKGITTAYTAETIDSEIDVLGDIVWKDRKGKAMWPTADNNTYDTGTLTTADAVLALYGYSIKVELSDKTNFKFERFGSDSYYYSFNQLERNISCTCGEDSNIPYCSLCGLI